MQATPELCGVFGPLSSHSLVAYTAWCAREREEYLGRWHKFGPLILVSISFVLVMMDPTRHVFMDWGVWTSPVCSSAPNLFCSVDLSLEVKC
jgi:hypothetical protein